MSNLVSPPGPNTGRIASPSPAYGSYEDLIADCRKHADDPPNAGAGTGLRTSLRIYDGLECEGMDAPLFD